MPLLLRSPAILAECAAVVVVLPFALWAAALAAHERTLLLPWATAHNAPLAPAVLEAALRRTVLTDDVEDPALFLASASREAIAIQMFGAMVCVLAGSTSSSRIP